MNVLVTGATGFTGGRLAETLARGGEQVRALVRPQSLARFAGSAAARAGVIPVAGDLADAAAIRKACDGVEVVYHIAALYREAGHRPSAYHEVNVQGTRTVLEAARVAGIRRVVHCSTGGVHGHVSQAPANEDAPFNPGDVYQETKLAGETLAREFGRQHAIEVAVARPIGIYGPGDTRFLKMFRGISRGRFPMLGSGTPFYHLTFVDDVVEGLTLCGTRPDAAGRTYLIAGPEYTTLERLVAIVAEELGTTPPRWHLPVWPFWTAGLVMETVLAPLGIDPPLHRRRVDFYTKSRAFTTARARAELGYAPQVELRSGIRRTVAWYREQGWL